MEDTERVNMFLPKSLKKKTMACSHLVAYGNMSEYIRQALEEKNKRTEEKTACQNTSGRSSASSE